MSNRDKHTTTIRMPNDLHAQLEAIAEQEERSLNQIIVMMLRREVEAQRKEE